MGLRSIAVALALEALGYGSAIMYDIVPDWVGALFMAAGVALLLAVGLSSVVERHRRFLPISAVAKDLRAAAPQSAREQWDEEPFGPDAFAEKAVAKMLIEDGMLPAYVPEGDNSFRMVAPDSPPVRRMNEGQLYVRRDQLRSAVKRYFEED